MPNKYIYKSGDKPGLYGPLSNNALLMIEAGSWRKAYYDHIPFYAHTELVFEDGGVVEEGEDVVIITQYLYGDINSGNGIWLDCDEQHYHETKVNERRRIAVAVKKEKEDKGFQSRVNDWMLACFGEVISKDRMERNHRFIEEALELVQSTGATKSECLQLVEYVFERPTGEVTQEVGGVMVTLVALCNTMGLSIEDLGEIELKRIWTKIDKIREKQAAKPRHSPLPSHPKP